MANLWELSRLMSKYDIERKIYYSLPGRFYHNWNHIEKMLSDAMDDAKLTPEMELAIVYHDVVYDPKSSTNEEDSIAELPESSAADFGWKYLKPESKEQVRRYIRATKENPGFELSEDEQYFRDLDRRILKSTSYEELLKWEQNIFKEFQSYDYTAYRTGRLEFLSKQDNPLIKNDLMSYVRNRKITLGVYVGSFNPFHKGHLNVVEKAEKIFDKVLVVRAVNTDKIGIDQVPLTVPYREVLNYDGLTTTLVKKYRDQKDFYSNVTLVRGIRNSSDYAYEINLLRLMRDMDSQIESIMIPCDREFEHISSSALRALEKLGPELSAKYLI
jgi:pantetheine-phosphate adenylyltransferase